MLRKTWPGTAAAVCAILACGGSEERGLFGEGAAAGASQPGGGSTGKGGTSGAGGVGAGGTGGVASTSCSNSLDCADRTDQRLVCDAARGECVECARDADCDPGMRCMGNACREPCDSDLDCTPLRLLCDLASGYCAQCTRDADCGDARYCDSGTCRSGTCIPGARVCQGNAIATCSDAGSGFETTTPCGADEVCVSTATSVQCEPRVSTGTGGTFGTGGAPGGAGGQPSGTGGTGGACDETACPPCTGILESPCCTGSGECGCGTVLLCSANAGTGGTPGTGVAWSQCQVDAECADGRICSKSATGTRPGSCTYNCTFPSTAACDPPLAGAGATQCPAAGICAMLCGPGDTCPAGRECVIVSGNGPYCVYPEAP